MDFVDFGNGMMTFDQVYQNVRTGIYVVLVSKLWI